MEKPWYARWWAIAIWIVLGMAVLGNLGDDEPAANEQTDVQEEVEPEPTVDVAERVAQRRNEANRERERREARQERERAAAEREAEREQEAAASGGHDWPSDEAYMADMIDSSESITGALNLLTAATQSAGRGEITFDQVADLADTFRATLDTHRSHFAGRTPPPQFTEVNRLALSGWDHFDESATLFAQGARTGNEAMITEAAGLMDEGAALLRQATSAIPN